MDILSARETRAHHIESLMKEYADQTIIVMKGNIPGYDKNPKRTIFMCRYFHKILKETFGTHILAHHFVQSLDGDYTYYVVEEEGNMVKEKTILIEKMNALGRLIDLDVYHQTAISRSDLKCEMRRCLICNNYAPICVRDQSHPMEDIIAKTKQISNDFLLDLLLSKSIECIYYELKLYPKFGLVSSRNSGCHSDMTFETFVESIFAIKPFIREFILYGIHETDNPLRLQKIGIEAEKAMFKATNGVNTHKGLIFLLGVFLPVFTKAILNQDTVQRMQENISRLASEIVGNYYDSLKDKSTLSHGDAIYLAHGLQGVRGQAINGLNLMFECPSYNHQTAKDAYLEYLLYFMSRLDDTTIIHKTDIATLKEVQQTIRQIIEKGGYAENVLEVHALSEQYKKRNISPGGSADLLVVKLIYDDLKYLLIDSK